mgnify:CR=1 FL=1
MNASIQPWGILTALCVSIPKDFIFVFQLGFNETMNDSLAICQENFRLHWGQKLVNTLRALHEVKYAQGEDEEEETADFEY